MPNPTHAPRQLIRELNITNGDEASVGYYVGMMVRLQQPNDDPCSPQSG